LWQGQIYSSLSTTCLRITGTSWHGPRFFGLRGSVDPAPSSAAAHEAIGCGDVSVIHSHGRGGHRGASSVTVAVSTEFRFGLLFPVYSAGVSPISNLYAAMGTLSARFRAQAKGSRSPQHSTADLERECNMAQITQRTMAPPAHVVTRTCWRRSQLIACLMLAVSAIVFEMNGHTPGAVNLRGRNLLPAVSLMDGRQFR
jgi:hypothetical protein